MAHVSIAALFALTIITTFPKYAFAYLDPGTLGMLFQVLVAAIAGSLLFFKVGFSRVKSFFKNLFGAKK